MAEWKHWIPWLNGIKTNQRSNTRAEADGAHLGEIWEDGTSQKRDLHKVEGEADAVRMAQDKTNKAEKRNVLKYLKLGSPLLFKLDKMLQ